MLTDNMAEIGISNGIYVHVLQWDQPNHFAKAVYDFHLVVAAVVLR